MAQQGGWSSTPFAADLTVQDAFSRNLLMKYGGRSDSIWDFHDMPGYRTTMGSASYAGSSVVNPFVKGTGSVSLRSYGGGGTPSNPGGYNYGTLGRSAEMAGQLVGTAANFAMDRRPGADPDLDFRFGNTPIYNRYRGKQQKIERIGRVRDLKQSRVESAQKASQMAGIRDVARTAQQTSQILQPPVQGPPAPGTKPATSSPLRRPRFNAEVDLLNTNRFPSVNKPTAAYDPGSIWASDAPDDESYSYDTGQSGDNFWSNLSSMDTQQGGPAMSGTTQQTSTRPTGAAGASQRPNQPRNRGRGPRNRGFGKRL